MAASSALRFQLLLSLPLFVNAEETPEFTFFSLQQENCAITLSRDQDPPGNFDRVFMWCGDAVLQRGDECRWDYHQDGTLRPRRAPECGLALELGDEPAPHDFQNVFLWCGEPTTSWKWDMHTTDDAVVISPRSDSSCRLAADISTFGNAGKLHIWCSGGPDVWSKWKMTPKVTAAGLLDMVYPTLDQLPPIPLTKVDQFNYCNDNDEPMPFAKITKTLEVTTGSQWQFHFDTSLKFESEVSVKASGGIPALEHVEGEAKMKWGVEMKAGLEVSGSTQVKSTFTVEYPAITLKPHTATTYRYSQFDGQSNLPYTATLRLSFDDGTHIDNKVSGEMKSVEITQITQAWCNEMHNVTSCAALQGDVALLV